MANVLSYLLDIPTKIIKSAGNVVDQSRTLNFKGNLAAVYNSATKEVDVDSDPSLAGELGTVLTNSADAIGIEIYNAGNATTPQGLVTKSQLDAAAAVTSVFGRVGAVTQVSGDYDATQISYDNSTSGLTATEQQSAIDELAATNASAPSNALLAHTGWLSGGEVTINADPTLFDMTRVTGWILDHSNPLTPVAVPVDAGPFTGVSVTNLATALSSGIAIDSSNSIVQVANGVYTDTQYRTLLRVATLAHTVGTSIEQVIQLAQPAWNGIDTVMEFIDLIGPGNVSGNVFSANGANLSLDKSAGKFFILNHDSRVSPLNPNKPLSPAETIVEFYRTFRDPVNPDAVTVEPGMFTVLNPGQWDNNGVLDSVGASQYTVVLMSLSPGQATSASYGQQVFANQGEAEEFAHQGMREFEERGQLRVLVQRAFIVLRGNATDLTNSTHATIIRAPAFRAM